MSIRELQVKIEQLRHLRWLEEIRKEYAAMTKYIENNGDSFCIIGIGYECRSEGQRFEVNPHRTLNNKYIIAALCEAVENLDQEIADLTAKIER